MSLQRLSYETIRDRGGPYDGAATPAGGSRCLIRAKPRTAVAVTLATAAVATLGGLALLQVYGAGSDAAAAAGSASTGWQDRQPLAGSTLTAFSENLKSPENRFSKDGELRTTLRIAPTVAQAGPLAPPLNVRAYEGSVPGPTLRVKPGDRLVVSLVNDLGTPEGDPEAGGGGGGDGRAALEGKVEAWPNVTNLHVHGLHVSPSGVSDNIYRRANPGDSLEYVYDLPPDHYPGTFYYHPHFEGSSSMQTLGGMSGAIVVEDPEGSLPPEIEAMREVVMVLQETNIESGSLRNYKAASEIAGSNMPLYGGGSGSSRAESKERPAEEEGGEDEVLHFATVNGQYQPIVQAQPGEAFRVRLIHGGNNDHMHVSLVPADATATATATATQGTGQGERREDHAAEDQSGWDKASGGCTLLTLARDGVYLSPAPRLQGGGRHVVIAPGSRADLAVRCDEAGVYRLSSSKGSSDEEEEGEEEEEEEEGEEASIMSYLGQNTDVFEGTLAFVDIGGDALDMELPEASPAAVGFNRLLQDLRDIPDDEVSRFVFEFNAADKVSHLGYTYTWYGVNGVQYTNSSHVTRRVPLGSVEEWVIVNQRKGRGEGEQGCRPPPLPTPPRPNAKEEPVDAITGGSRNGDDEGAVDEGGGARGRVPVGCGRGGPGKVTADGHPFHLHVNHFQVVGSSWGDDGPDWSVGDWRDTISIPTPGNVTIRWRADDFTGEAVAHCHIFGHSDTGMMMNFEIFDST